MKKSRVVMTVALVSLVLSTMIPGARADSTSYTVTFVDQLPLPGALSTSQDGAAEPAPGSAETEELESALVPLRDILDENLSNFAGFTIDWETQTYLINVVDRDGPGMTALKTLMATHGEGRFELRDVPLSDAELLRKMDSFAIGNYSSELVGAMTEMYAEEATGTVMMTLDEQMASASGATSVMVESGSEQNSSRSQVNVQEIADRMGMNFVITIQPRDNTEPSVTRRSSSAPYVAGAGIRTVKTALDTDGKYKYGLCSLGMPNLKLNGVNLVSSTAHCAYGVFNQPWETGFKGENGSALGSVYANSNTSGFGTQIYGEWLLIRGSTSLNAFVGASVLSSDTAGLTGADFAAVGENASVCTSGRTTGGRCRLRIIQRHVYKNMPFKTLPTTNPVTVGTLVARLTMTKYDPGWNNVYTCGGFQGGDSGGLAFYADSVRPGQYWGYGMVQSTTTPSSGTDCTYYIQELNGIRAKYPNIGF